MRHVGGNEGSSDKVEKSRVQQELKEIIDRQCSSTFTCDTGAVRENKKNPLQDFFVDEIDHIKQLLNVVRTDMDTLSFEDNEVRVIILNLILNYTLNYTFTLIMLIINWNSISTVWSHY